jgi:hypothetical protein
MQDRVEFRHFRYLLTILEWVALVSWRNSFEIEASSMCRRYVFSCVGCISWVQQNAAGALVCLPFSSVLFLR